jgi:hypothetical protein
MSLSQGSVLAYKPCQSQREGAGYKIIEGELQTHPITSAYI